MGKALITPTDGALHHSSKQPIGEAMFSPFSLSNVDLEDLYLAYKKAKCEAFYENTHFHALSFTNYEQNLERNLKLLMNRLRDECFEWCLDSHFIGDHAYLPKSVNTRPWDDSPEGHFRALDPKDDWQLRFNQKKVRADASLRLVIRPTVDFQVLSSLWIIHVGHLFDYALDGKASFGNRIRRARGVSSDMRVNGTGVNRLVPSLFVPYFSSYRSWRENGLRTMEQQLAMGKGVVGITMDIEKFYHRVAPEFLLREEFLATVGLKLEEEEVEFTSALLTAMSTWYHGTPDYESRPEGAIPVGLSASKIVANVLLNEFDRRVSGKLRPLYYGRYVDDVFLVVPSTSSSTIETVAEKIRKSIGNLAEEKKEGDAQSTLRLRPAYAFDSELVFSGDKQKTFILTAKHGMDLIHHIRDQIRVQSSEYRLLPSVPTSQVDMASKALLATPDATLQVDALRKADVVSVRRLGFSLLLSDIETYAQDLKPETWINLRREFYGLVSRHVLTPTGFFNYFGYIHRVFGLMIACGDVVQAKDLIADLRRVANLLQRTTSLGEGKRNKKCFALCMEQYAAALLQAAIQGATSRAASFDANFQSVVATLQSLCPSIEIPRTPAGMRSLAHRVLLADWGRRPYKEYWFRGQTENETGPALPNVYALKRQLAKIRRFRMKATELKVPHWPALTFPTRPLRIDEIVLLAPPVLEDEDLLRQTIGALRGAKVVTARSLGLAPSDGSTRVFNVPGKGRGTLEIAVTSVETTEEQWSNAVDGVPDRSLSRYVAFNSLLNNILRSPRRPHYVVLPELSIPLKWALRAGRKLAANGISMLAGIEYRPGKEKGSLKNDCLVSLTTRWPGYFGSVMYLQSKFAPAHGERSNLRSRKKAMCETPLNGRVPIIYRHRDFFFSVLICSDLTNISHRTVLRGKIDALFALEWNQDVKTFSSLVESSAVDLHAFIIQVNNRCFGDSRIRSPAAQDFHRDVVQVKGGASDYYVIGSIDVNSLRLEQSGKRTKKDLFKPLPVGFDISNERKTAIRPT